MMPHEAYAMLQAPTRRTAVATRRRCHCQWLLSTSLQVIEDLDFNQVVGLSYNPLYL